MQNGDDKMVRKRISRTEKTVVNTAAGFINEIVTLICGLILPRLILTHFGSEYNGITSSITQFISCISLLKAGIGGVTRASLYKPIAENDKYEISVIINQTEKFMRKIAVIFVLFVIVFAAVYPGLIDSSFDWLFSFSLIIIISLSTFAQYYFGLTYQMLLYADQRQWIVMIVNAVSIVCNTIIATLLINLDTSIHIVKLGSSVVFVSSSIWTCYYVKKIYGINTKATSDKDYIKQRWDALGQEIANFVNNNTDIMVLTIFTNLFEVSVYAVYNSVVMAVQQVVRNLITSFGAAFGDMFAKKEYELMENNLRLYELIVFSLTTIFYSVVLVMVVPFVVLYTADVKDVEYARYTFAVIISIAGAFNCFSIPYHTVTAAIGHYKQTRNGAFVEAGINLTISIILVIKLGLVGVAIGTLIAAVFRMCRFAIYLGKNVLPRKNTLFIKHSLLSLCSMLSTYLLAKLYMPTVDSAVKWIAMAAITTIVATIITYLFHLIMHYEDVIKLVKKLKTVLLKNKK